MHMLTAIMTVLHVDACQSPSVTGSLAVGRNDLHCARLGHMPFASSSWIQCRLNWARCELQGDGGVAWGTCISTKPTPCPRHPNPPERGCILNSLSKAGLFVAVQESAQGLALLRCSVCAFLRKGRSLQ